MEDLLVKAVALRPIVTACQKVLGVEPDGIPYWVTWKAIYKHLTSTDWQPEAEPDKPALPADHVDERSEKNIATLLPEVQLLARQLVIQAGLQGIDIRITSGTRTPEEQNELYSQGRSKPGKIITNARAWQSNHNYGLALDFTIFDGSSPVWESPLYEKVAKIGESLGFTSGGNWTSQDWPHLEIRPKWSAGLTESETIAKLRIRKESGRDLLV